MTTTTQDLVNDIRDSHATREDWLRALDEAFPPGNQPPLDPHGERDTNWLVSWEIDVDVVDTPAQAAAAVWLHNFDRGPVQPSNQECCVFTVTDRGTGQSVQIDLSDEQMDRLFR